MVILYGIVIVVLQSVIFARINFFGVFPDLILVSVISFAVLQSGRNPTLFAGGAALLQDILSFGVYLNTITRVMVCALVSGMKESFAGNEYSLVAGLVVFFTPVLLLLEGGFYAVFAGRQIDPLHLLFSILIATFYNLFMVPILFPIVKKLSHA